jgi:hypothetical protein
MRRIVIAALVCVNVALLAALLLGADPAEAQVVGGGTDYMVITARIAEGHEAVFIIDVGEQEMAAWKFDRKRRRLVGLGEARQLTRDFRR